jgi:hypothetical protein
LTDEKAEGQIAVNSLQDLSILMNDYLEKTGRSVLLLDGSEYLITNHGFDAFIRFLQTCRSRVERKESILLTPIFEEALDSRMVKMIEREMQQLEN